jgi:hypothetical protein
MGMDVYVQGKLVAHESVAAHTLATLPAPPASSASTKAGAAGGKAAKASNAKGKGSKTKGAAPSHPMAPGEARVA